MKTILYFLIAILILGMVVPGIVSKSASSHTLIIAPVGMKLSGAALSQSADIITARLRDFSQEKFDIKILPEKNQMQIVLHGTWDLPMAEKLVVQQGKIEFHESVTSEVLLRGADMDSFKIGHDKATGMYYLNFKFKPSAFGVWAGITERNLNKPVSMVMDDKVIFDPVVKDVIQGGNCQISGNFTESELRFIAAIARNGELPSEFEVIK